MHEFSPSEAGILTVLVEAEKHSISEYISRNHEFMDSEMKKQSSEYLGKIIGILAKLKEE